MSLRRIQTLALSVGAASVVATLSLAGFASAQTPDLAAPAPMTFRFQNAIYSQNGEFDVRFTQLLGINDHGRIAGYHGDENTENTPNKGFTLMNPDQVPVPFSKLTFRNENFPDSVQTQVIGINNAGDTVGFYIDQAGVTHGFLKPADKPFVTADRDGTTFNQLLGINNEGQAVGYSQDNANPPLQHAYVREKNGHIRLLELPMPSSQATSINDNGTVVGFLQQSSADTQSTGFLLENGKVTELTYPGSTFTQALGVNNNDQVVGSYMDANGVVHGFLYEDGNYQSIDYSNADNNTTGTVVNGINNHGVIVGFYTRTVGLLGTMTTETDTQGFIARPNK